MNILNRIKRKAMLFSLALLCTFGGALALHATAPTVETVIPAVAEETTESSLGFRFFVDALHRG